MRAIKVCTLYVLAFLTLLTGCGKPAGSDSIQTAQACVSCYFQGGSRCAAFSGSGYYFSCGNFLYYADQDSMSPVVVCNRPNCLHDHETDPEKLALCNGYFDPYMKGNAAVFCSDGKLYVLTKVVNEIQDHYTDELILFEVSADGSSRREAIRVSLPTGFQMPDTVVVYRDELIVGSTVYDEDLVSCIEISAYPLTGVQKKPRILYHKEAHGYISSLICSGKYLYFIELNENGEYVHKILNTETLEAICLEDNAAYAHFDAIDFAPFSDGLIVAGYRDSSVCLMKAELNGENPAEWIPAQNLPLESLGLMASDEWYLYIQFRQRNADNETKPMMMVMDRQGNRAAILDLDERIPGFREVQITSGEYMLFTGETSTQGGRHESAYWYIDKSQLASGDIRPVLFWEE